MELVAAAPLREKGQAPSPGGAAAAGEAQGKEKYLEGIFKLFAPRSQRYTPHLLQDIRSHTSFAWPFV